MSDFVETKEIAIEANFTRRIFMHNGIFVNAKYCYAANPMDKKHLKMQKNERIKAKKGRDNVSDKETTIIDRYEKDYKRIKILNSPTNSRRLQNERASTKEITANS